MPQTLSSPARRAPLDERSFEQLLAAAFVIQQHNDSSKNDRTKNAHTQNGPPQPKLQANDFDFTRAVSAAGALQQELVSDSSDLPASARLIADRALQVTSADGAAVGIVVDDSLTYIGVAGTAASDAGRRFSIPDSLSASCIVRAETVQCSGAHRSNLPHSFAGRNDLRSFIASPVTQKGAVLGVFELRFSDLRSFSPEEVRAAELFAGIVNVAITTAARKHAASNLESRESDAAAELSSSRTNETQEPERFSSAKVLTRPADTTSCVKCGSAISLQESYCGRCGASQHAAEDERLETDALTSVNEFSATDVEDPSSLELFPGTSTPSDEGTFATHGALALQQESDALAPAESLRIVPAENARPEETEAIEPAPWSSAKKALAWFEGLRRRRPAFGTLRDLWQEQRANIWLGASALILLFAIVQFFLSPVSSPAAAANHNAASGPQLTFFEGLLVSLGLADAPPTVSYAGNPEARVWVDTRTALYYCAGTGQYGKTPGGKFTTQRDAQQDQFEPAHRKVCP